MRTYYLRKLVSVAFSAAVVGLVYWLVSPTPGTPDLRDPRIRRCDLNPSGERLATHNHFHVVSPGVVRCFVNGRERSRFRIDVTPEQEND